MTNYCETRCCRYAFDPDLEPGARDPLTSRQGCPIFWNEYNRVVQCHNCGQVYVPDGLEPLVVAMERVNRNEAKDVSR